MRGKKAKALRRARMLAPAQVRAALKSLAAKHEIEVDGDLDGDPSIPMNYIINRPERALELCLADPNIYKTPAGNLLTLVHDDDGNSHFMSPEEAEAWQVDAEEIDRQHPGGTRV